MMRDDKRCDGRLRDLERRKPRFFRFCMYSHGLAFQSIPLNLCGWDVVTCCCWWKFRAMMFFRRRTKKRCMHVAETLPYAPATCMSNQSDKPLPAKTTRNWDDKARVASTSTERREECHLQTTVPSELHLPIFRSHRSDRSNALTTWSTFTNEDRNTHTHTNRTSRAIRTTRAEPSAPESQTDTHRRRNQVEGKEQEERECQPSTPHLGSRPTAPASAPYRYSRAPRSRPSWRFGSSGCRRGCGISGPGGRWCLMRLGLLVVSLSPVFGGRSGYGGGLAGVGGKGGLGAGERGDSWGGGEGRGL